MNKTETNSQVQRTHDHQMEGEGGEEMSPKGEGIK